MTDVTKKKYYAVAIGRQPGIYTQWFGAAGAQAQVSGFPGARYKGFATIEEARTFMQAQDSAAHTPGKGKSRIAAGSKASSASMERGDLKGRIVIYTDGSSLGNPGPGGYGVVIPSNSENVELCGGFRKTTNNRMELLACIIGLEQLGAHAAVALYSDSRYVVDGITKGWARKWRRNGWRRNSGEAALNIDLWERLLALCDRHDVHFIWVRGHAGNPGNERCDQLATQAAAGRNLPADKGYEGGSGANA